MADVYVCWYLFDKDDTIAPRSEIQALVQELGLPWAPMSKPSLTEAFIRVAGAAKVVYTDEDGTEQAVTGRQVAKKAEFTTFEAVRGDGKRLAQLKFFPATRTRDGVKRGTHRTKSIVRSIISPPEEDAARTWVRHVEELLDAETGYVPWYVLRRIVRALMDSAVTPMYKRPTVFFAYPDQLPQVERIRAFVYRALKGATFDVLPLAAGADLSTFVMSADMFLAGRAEALAEQVGEWKQTPHGVPVTTASARWVAQFCELAEQHARHQRELSGPLTQTGLALLQATERIRAVVPSASLPSVSI